MFQKRISIKRKKDLKAKDFTQDHLQGFGEPVIVTDAMKDWAALSKWTLKKFKAEFGSDLVSVSSGKDSIPPKLTNFEAFIDYLDKPDEELSGIWYDEASGKYLPGSTLSDLTIVPKHYLYSWHAFQKHPVLYDDIKPASYFVEDWHLKLSPALHELIESHERELYSIYIAPEGAVTQLHQDFWHTHSCLAQVQGRKQCLLFSPEDSKLLYGGDVDPENPDKTLHKNFHTATTYECILEPKETLFIPTGWWHHVRSLDKTITLSHNFCNEFNLNDYFTALSKNRPELAKILNETPQWREELKEKWGLN